MGKFMKSTIGAFLCHRLKQMGVNHVIGVPGDYNLEFLEQINDTEGLEFIGTCNELNAAYAADGYARVGGLSAMLTTYGVGDLSALNGVAGAYAEHVPMVCITGAPPIHTMQHAIPVHHSAADGNFSNVLNCFREFTVAQTCLTYADAAQEIDRVLRACWREKRPVYIQLPSDIAYLTIDVPEQPLTRQLQQGDEKSVAACVAYLQGSLKKAKRPALLLDMDADRLHLTEVLCELAERANIPFASLSSAKNVIDENHPLFLGVYGGQHSLPDVREYIENADFLIALSPRFIEVNSGHYTQALPSDTLYLHAFDLLQENRSFTGITAYEVLSGLVASLPEKTHQALPDVIRSKAPKVNNNFLPHEFEALTQARLWQRMAAFFRPQDIIIGENGTSNIALNGVTLPPQATYIAQPVWGSIGYTLPALLGSLLHNAQRRHILFIGDGSFQLTVQELSTIIAQGFKPIIFLLNNKGYTIERYILGESARYNDVNNWQYSQLPKVLSPNVECFTTVVHTEGELEQALSIAEDNHKLSFIELMLDPMDAPEKLKGFGKKTADFDYGPYGPQTL
jgi:indolepyruvate decarboxylase